MSIPLAAVPWILSAVIGLAGAGGTVWYRMQYLDCIADGARALQDQREIDKADNAKAVGALNKALQTNEGKYNAAVEILSKLPKTSDACQHDPRIRAARDLLCQKYPESQTCVRP